jgi:hypothetical protein
MLPLLRIGGVYCMRVPFVGEVGMDEGLNSQDVSFLADTLILQDSIIKNDVSL